MAAVHGTPVKGAPAAMTECLIVRLDTETYAIELGRVAEVHQLVAVTPAPDATGGLVGYVDIRGRVVPVVDLRLALGAQPRPWDASMHLVVCSVGEELVALAVDRVEGVAEMELDARDDASHAAVTAVARSESLGLLPVLDPSALSPGHAGSRSRPAKGRAAR